MAVELTLKRDVSSFRMIAMGTWKDAKDPSVYGSMSLEVDEMLAYIEAFRAHTGKHLTLTHVMAKAVGKVMEAMPDANAMIRFWRIYLRKDIDVFFQVVMKDPKTGQIDLSGLTVRKVDQKSLGEVVDEFRHIAEKVRAGKDEEKESTRSLFKSLPGWLVGWILDLTSFLIYGLNLDLRWAGLPKDPFGSAMVTNIGSLGLEEAYVPLVPYSRCPLLIAMGAVKKVPVVGDDDEIRVAQMMRIFATFDHRVLDGAHAATMASTIQEIFADPWTHLDPIPRATDVDTTPPDGENTDEE